MAPKLQNSGLSVLLLAITLILSWWIAEKAHSHLPKANNGIEGFVASRARKHLDNITSFGPRPTGSPENEIMALNTIIETLSGIQRNNRQHNNQDFRDLVQAMMQPAAL